MSGDSTPLISDRSQPTSCAWSNGWIECRWTRHAPRAALPSQLNRQFATSIWFWISYAGGKASIGLTTWQSLEQIVRMGEPGVRQSEQAGAPANSAPVAAPMVERAFQA